MPTNLPNRIERTDEYSDRIAATIRHPDGYMDAMGDSRLEPVEDRVAAGILIPFLLVGLPVFYALIGVGMVIGKLQSLVTRAGPDIGDHGAP